MKPLLSSIKTDDASFQVNAAHHKMLAAELQERTARIRQGGGKTARQRHTDQGKLFVHDCVNLLLDPQSPFLELSPLAAWDRYDRQAAAAGIVTGIGRVSGKEVMIVANDATVKGGAYYPMTVKNPCALSRLHWRTDCPASIWSTPAAPFCLCRTKCFPMQTISVVSSTIKRP